MVLRPLLAPFALQLVVAMVARCNAMVLAPLQPVAHALPCVADPLAPMVVLLQTRVLCVAWLQSCNVPVADASVVLSKVAPVSL